MHPPELRARAMAMHDAGVPFGRIWRELGLPRGTVGHWLHDRRGRIPRRTRACVCSDGPDAITAPDRYSYLVGQYLGDGHLLTTQRVPLLGIYCDPRYPAVVTEVEEALRACGARAVRRRVVRGCVGVLSYGVHWPCLFPQHGPGLKHERRIELAPWQREVVANHPGPFLRGLFHSDGCRTVNRITVRGRRYAYPRYLFTNRSADILDLCRWALDLLGIAWRRNRADSLSVARREAVAALDRHVGPKR